MRKIKTALAGLLALALLTSPAMAEGESVPEGENSAPVAENQELQTYRGVSVGGRLSAYDAEGDAVSCRLETEPIKGDVTVSPDGYFIYTPKANKRGRDYFGFRATDAEGNVSQEGTVIIQLIRQKSRTTYADMEGDPMEYAAVSLTEAGIFTGQTLGSDTVFDPDAPVTRGEFLAMSMTAADTDLLSGVQATGFQDDGDISPWLKPYVATAMLRGIVEGSPTETGAVFRPDDGITLRDACTVLNAVLGVTDVVDAAAMESGEPGRASQAVANLTASRVMPVSWTDLDSTLTRAQAAELLQNAMELLSRR